MKTLIEKYALENALRFNGKANIGAVIGSVIKENQSVKKNIKELQKRVSEIVKKVNSMKLSEQGKKLEELAPELLEKKAKNEKDIFSSFKTEEKVITAFPPEPSKYPHIGHAKALFVNYEFAKRNNGKFILRFEDTNPELAKEEFYKIHLKSYAWLGVIPDKIDYASDFMNKYYEFAEKLIDFGKAYVCVCPQEKISKGRKIGKACNCRYNHIKENLLLWKKMSSMKSGEAILRLKIDLKHKNSTMRDPSMFRIINKNHCRTGKKYCVWPTYDFENAVMDGLEGITHRFRSKEFEMRNELQRYIQRLLSFEETNIYEFARFNLKGVESSGRKIRALIKEKKLSGWNDPSLSTLASLRRRGFLPEAIKKFVLSTGITKSESTLTWDNLIMHNKRILDADCNRYFFVKDPVRIRLQDAPKQKIELKCHPEFSERGVRKLSVHELFYICKDDLKLLADKKLYRLMGCLNFEKKNGYFIFKGNDLFEFKKKGDKIIHWLPFRKGLANVEVLMPDKKIVSGLAELSVLELKKGEVIQFERFGFCRLDRKYKNKLFFWFSHK